MKKFNHSLTIYSLMIISLLLSVSCAAPPPPPPPPPVTWGEVISEGPVLKVKESSLHFELWTKSKSLPTREILETDLAKTGLLADLHGGGDQYEVELGDTSCQLEWSPIDKNLRGERVSLCAEQLNPQRSSLLANSTHLLSMDCKGPLLGAAIDSHNISFSFSKKLEPIWISLPQGRCSPIIKQIQFKTIHYLKIHHHPIGEKEWAMWTKGMGAFGMKEVALVGLRPNQKKIAKERLLSIADGMLRVEGQRVKGELYIGPTHGIYATTAQIKNHHPLPDQISGMLIPVSPKASVDDREALYSFTRRLLLP